MISNRKADKSSNREIILLIMLFVFVLCSSLAFAQSSTPREETWVTDGIVYEIVRKNNIVYIGGEFASVSLNSGKGLPLDISSGKSAGLFPKVNGTILDCAPDGSGGWYISGEFTRVAGLAVNYIAHILSDGTMDTAWTPNPDDCVYTIAVSGSTVYAGGAFTKIGGQTRSRIAALDTTAGESTPWNPNVNGNIYTLAVTRDGNTVYAGGEFTTVGTEIRNNIAAIDASSGAATAWNPNANESVLALAVSNDMKMVYIGGEFTEIGGRERRYIASLDSESGVAADWNPSANDSVFALEVSDDMKIVYTGGKFTEIGGQVRNYIAALDSGSGAANSWNPDADDCVYTIEVSSDGNIVYTGGDFTKIGGKDRNRIAALNTDVGFATDWDPNASGSVFALAVSDSKVYVGGRFASINLETRNRIAALDALTGAATGWNPNANNTVYALAVSDDGQIIYAGGTFTVIGMQTRSGLAALYANTGWATSWFPNSNNTVLTLALSGDGTSIYAGGYFSSIGGEYRNRIAELDTETAAATDWNPNSNELVNAIALSPYGNTVYVGGNFSTIGGQSRNRIAALNADTGAATTWNPNADSDVKTLVVSSDGNTVYAGGNFTSIGGQNRSRIAALNASTGIATTWNPSSDGLVKSLALSEDESRIYIGGNYTRIGGQTYIRISAVDTITGEPFPWNPSANGIIHSLFISDLTLYVGGGFTTIGGLFKSSVAEFDLQSTTPTVTPTPSITYTPTNTSTAQITSTPTFTLTYTPTFTATKEPTNTPTGSLTFTYTPSHTSTPTFTPTIDQTPTFTPTRVCPDAEGITTIVFFNGERLQEVAGWTKTEVDNLRTLLEGSFDDLVGIKLMDLGDPQQTGYDLAGFYHDWDTHTENFLEEGRINLEDLRNNAAKACIVSEEIKSQQKELIKKIPPGSPLKYILIIGDDQVIPFYRLEDETENSGSRESDYGDLIDLTKPIGAALGANYILTDDYYGDQTPGHDIGLGRDLYTSDLITGRLVENPEDISNLINYFLSICGNVEPDCVLLGSSEWYRDAADRIVDYLLNDICIKVYDPRTPEEFYEGMTQRGLYSKDIHLLGFHGDHQNLILPARTPVPLSVDSIYTGLDSNYLQGEIIFSLGSHTGLNVPQGYGNDKDSDFPEMWTGKKILAYIGPTTFSGYSRDYTAYNEELGRLFMEELFTGSDDSRSVGLALKEAKERYLLDIYPGINNINQFHRNAAANEKVLLGTTIFGLPMVEIGMNIKTFKEKIHTDTNPVNTRTKNLPNGLLEGNAAGELPIPIEHSTDSGRFFSFYGDVVVNDGEPLQPKQGFYTGMDNHIPKGVVLEKAEYVVIPEFQPVIERSGWGPQSAANSESILKDYAKLGWFPPIPFIINTIDKWEINSSESLPPLQSILVIGGQYNYQKGSERRYTRMDLTTYFLPTNTGITDTQNPGISIESKDITFSSDIHLRIRSNEALVRCVVALTEGNGNWDSIDMECIDDVFKEWVVEIANKPDIEYFIQAVDLAGNVTYNDNNGYYHKFTADLNGDFKTNANDIFAFSEYWHKQEYADFNHDNIVDQGDLKIIIDEILKE